MRRRGSGNGELKVLGKEGEKEEEKGEGEKERKVRVSQPSDTGVGRFASSRSQCSQAHWSRRPSI